MEDIKFNVEKNENIVKISILNKQSYVLIEKVNDHLYNGIKTQVQDGDRGKGYGKLLIDELAKWLRKNNAKVIPICPFIEKIMRDSKYFDVLFK